MRKLILLAMVASLTLATIGMATGAVTAAAATCTPTGFVRDSINLTAAKINPPGTFHGNLDATGCNIGIYYDSGNHRVSGAEIHGSNYFGIVVNGDVTNVKVDIVNSLFYQIGESPFNGTQHGVAIYESAYVSGTVTSRIEGNQVSRYQKSGIVANGSGTRVTIRHNKVTGLGPINFIAQNGIQIGFGATGTVSHNEVSENVYSPATWADGGILMLAAGGGVEVDHNDLTANDVGIWVNGTSGAKIHDNKVIGSTWDGIALDNSYGVTDGNNVSDNRVSKSGDGIGLYGANDNIVDGNRVFANVGPGIVLDYGSTANAIRKNRANDNGGDGIQIVSAGNTISKNSAQDNEGLDISNVGANVYGGNRCDTSSGSPVDCPSSGGDHDHGGHAHDGSGEGEGHSGSHHSVRGHSAKDD